MIMDIKLKKNWDQSWEKQGKTVRKKRKAKQASFMHIVHVPGPIQDNHSHGYQ